MDHNQLKTFVTVVELNSFTKAAEVLHVTQSTVTSRVNSLEKFYGKELLSRSNKGVHLTASGEKLFPFLTKQLEIIERSIEAISDKEEQIQLHIGAPHSLWRMPVMKGINQFLKNEKEINLKLSSDHSGPIIQSVIDEQYDLGIIYNAPMKQDLLCMNIGLDTYSIYRHKSLELPGKINIERLQSLPWIYINWGHPFNTWIKHQLNESFNPVIEVSNSNMAIDLLYTMKGISILSDDMVQHHVEQDWLKKVELDQELVIPSQSINLILKKAKYKNNRIKKLVEIIRRGYFK